MVAALPGTLYKENNKKCMCIVDGTFLHKSKMIYLTMVSLHNLTGESSLAAELGAGESSRKTATR